MKIKRFDNFINEETNVNMNKLHLLDIHSYSENEFKNYIEDFFIARMRKTKDFNIVKTEMITWLNEILKGYEKGKITKNINMNPLFTYSRYEERD